MVSCSDKLTKSHHQTLRFPQFYGAIKGFFLALLIKFPPAAAPAHRPFIQPFFIKTLSTHHHMVKVTDYISGDVSVQFRVFFLFIAILMKIINMFSR